jgi:hypothetical protein
MLTRLAIVSAIRGGALDIGKGKATHALPRSRRV